MERFIRSGYYAPDLHPAEDLPSREMWVDSRHLTCHFRSTIVLD
jgi:hypothetical protein